MLLIEIHGITGIESLHNLPGGVVNCLNLEMDMVGHETERMKMKWKPQLDHCEEHKVHLSILIIMKQGRSADSSIHNMVHCSFKPRAFD
ncbi:hypothetical protein A8F94_07355 [Bacillus sp. FJAT-27225]|nr:hypothetical protein [Bacillus sp. FJAT-27225]OCA87663.1 hypothetical protein A8F94_07355 [Bacillus sp. FJAT-27225]